MQIKALVTESGPHSPELMASACGDQIFSIDSARLDGPTLMAAQRLQLKINEALAPIFARISKETYEDLEADAETHFSADDLHDPSKWMDDGLAAVQAVADGTKWQNEFRDLDKSALIRQRIGQFMVDMVHLERLYFADRNKGHAVAEAYRENPTVLAVKAAMAPAAPEPGA